MEIVHIARRSKKKNLVEVSQTARMSKSTLWEIEQGSWLPEPEQAALLKETLGLSALPDSSQIITERQIRQLARPKPFDIAPGNRIPWDRMQRLFPKQLAQLKLPRTLLEWMKECLASDSPLECLLQCAVAADGATPILANPHQLGYRANCILDNKGFALGERYLAGLLWEIDGVPCILWPQVTVLTAKGSFRMDILVLISQSWENIEVNGKTHVLEHDQFRASVLGQPIVVDNDSVRHLTFLEPLKAELRKFLKKRRMRACA